MSDFEDDDLTNEAEKREFDRQFQKIEKNFYKVGFRQALTDDSINEKTLQNSFDSGFEIGFKIAKKFNQLYSLTRLIEGLYDEKRLISDSFEDLKKFNEKMGQVQLEIADMLKNIIIDPSKDFKVKLEQEFSQKVCIEKLTYEASDILSELDCPVKINEILE